MRELLKTINLFLLTTENTEEIFNWNQNIMGISKNHRFIFINHRGHREHREEKFVFIQ
jgi:hypothetical protein